MFFTFKQEPAYLDAPAVPQPHSNNRDLKSLPYAQIAKLVAAGSGKSFWGPYLFSFLHSKHVADLQEITPLPKPFRQSLVDAGYFVSQLRSIETCCDPDGTVKFLFGDRDERRFETVRLSDDDRHTLCVSTQVGCRMGCRFCATGRLSFTGNLTAGQIVDQVYQATAYGGRIHNVVFMGMGEPLDNIDALVDSIYILNDKRGLHLGQRHMTVSTCGLPEGIDHLATLGLQARLAVSLHAVDDNLRSQIMPINRRYDVQSVLAAVKRYQQHVGRRVTFEYIMMKDVNDRVAQARDLLRCLRGFKAHVNLIEFNDYPGSHYTASDPSALEQFAKVLREGGIETVVRFRRGRSIKAACGQLGAAWLEAQAQSN